MFFNLYKTTRKKKRRRKTKLMFKHFFKRGDHHSRLTIFLTIGLNVQCVVFDLMTDTGMNVVLSNTYGRIRLMVETQDMDDHA